MAAFTDGFGLWYSASMAIRTESTSTGELLLDARYHVAALLSDPQAEGLAAPVKAAVTTLRKARNESEEKQGERIEKQAIYDRADLMVDNHVRRVDRELLTVFDGRRDHEDYRQVFPRGASAIIGLRGTEESVAIDAMLKALAAVQPELFKRHDAQLKKLAKAAVEAESELLKAESAADIAFTSELAGRRALVRQLQKNEGALLALYPGERSTVRSYFRAVKRRAAEDDAEPTAPEMPGGGGR